MNSVVGGEPASRAQRRPALNFEDVLVSRLVQEKGGASSQESEQRFRDIIDALPAAVYTTDAKGRITHYNPACIELSGRTPTLGSDHWCVTWKLFNPDGTPLPHDECPMAIALREGRAIRGAEAIAERPDGTRIWFAPYPTPLKDASGNLVGGINMLVDITEQKISEQAERRRAAQLAAFMDTAAIGLHQAGPDGTILWANEADARLLGYRVDEYVGRHIGDFYADKKVIADVLTRLLRGEKVREYEARLRCRGGAIKTVLIDATALFEQGRFVHTQCFTIDITERKHSQALLRQQTQELSDLHRRKDEFLAMLSHELRNPLAPISNAIHLLRLDRGTQSQATQHARAIIERQVGQLSRLVDDLLEVSRITSGRIRLRPELVAATGIVERAVEACRPLIGSRRHELTVSLPEHPVWVQADPVRLEQIFVNLLNNACKYTDENGRISLTAEMRDGSFVLRVRDTGIGISPELLPTIFDLFTQSDRSLDRSQGGLGIGLALVHRLVEMHGGTVEVSSTVGVGSEFIVKLPTCDAPVTSMRQLDVGDPNTVCHRIVVVDDNLDSAESMAMLLKTLGHEVRTAHDSAGALAVALDFLPDVVIMDIGLPGASGFDVARAMRRQPRLEGITLIAFTGYGRDTDRRLCAEAGFDHHLAKPAAIEQVQALLAGIAPAARRSTS